MCIRDRRIRVGSDGIISCLSICRLDCELAVAWYSHSISIGILPSTSSRWEISIHHSQDTFIASIAGCLLILKLAIAFRCLSWLSCLTLSILSTWSLLRLRLLGLRRFYSSCLLYTSFRLRGCHYQFLISLFERRQYFPNPFINFIFIEAFFRKIFSIIFHKMCIRDILPKFWFITSGHRGNNYKSD